MSGLFSQLFTGLSGTERENAGPIKNVLTDVLGLNNPDRLTGLLSHFSNSGLGQHMLSWIGTGENAPVTANDVQNVLSNSQIQALIERTGLPVQALMPLVAKLLPHAVDQATPEGQLQQGRATDA